MTDGEQRRAAVFGALLGTLVIVILVKLLTGLAFGPLAGIALFLFAFGYGLALRLQRAGSSRSR